jgi:hypothetical protein
MKSSPNEAASVDAPIASLFAIVRHLRRATEYRFDKVERVRVETPDHKMFDVDADFDIPMVSPMPKVFQILCLLRHTQKADVPIGSKVTLLNKTAEQVAAPNSRPPSQLPTSPETQTPDSLRTPSSGGCG